MNNKKILSEIQSGSEKNAPRFELHRDQIEKMDTITSIVLAVVALAGVVSIAVLAPNLLKIVEKLILKKRNIKLSYKEQQRKIAQTFYYLKASNLIRFKDTEKGIWVALTEMGKKRIESFSFKTLYITKPKKWDAKWWLVAGDIPTKDFKKAADLFRKKLKTLGFFPLQRTLWLYPYNPVREIEFIANYFKIGKFITLMEINRLDRQDEERIKNFYHL